MKFNKHGVAKIHKPKVPFGYRAANLSVSIEQLERWKRALQAGAERLG
jgi:hypothetical protein